MLEELAEIYARTEAGQFDCSDLVRCVYNLNGTDMRILDKCSGRKGRTTAEMAKALGKDRSTVHRSLEKLMSCGLCYRERKGRSPRAFVDHYRILPMNEVIRMAESHLDACYKKVKKVLADAGAKGRG